MHHGHTYPSPNTQGFASLLDRMLLREKGGATVKKVAPELDVSPSTLYDYCAGRLTFPPDLIASLYRATGDRRILDFFMQEVGAAWFEIPECEDEPKAVLAGAISSQREFLDFLQAVLDSAADGKVSLKELRKIRDEFWEAVSHMARLLACAEADARREG